MRRRILRQSALNHASVLTRRCSLHTSYHYSLVGRTKQSTNNSTVTTKPTTSSSKKKVTLNQIPAIHRHLFTVSKSRVIYGEGGYWYLENGNKGRAKEVRNCAVRIKLLAGSCVNFLSRSSCVRLLLYLSHRFPRSVSLLLKYF